MVFSVEVVKDMRLANEQALWLLWAIPFMMGLYGWCFYRKHHLLGRFAQVALIRHINLNVSIQRQVGKGILLILAAVLMIAALMEPGWNPHPQPIERKGRDLIVLLDVSQSMLAEDIKPNRLERAKLDIRELLDELSDDRIGIIAFAGTSVIKCPLTHDYGFAKIALDQIDTQSVSRGGTLVGDAVRKAVEEVFDQEEKDFKDIILITDGEDHESYPLEAAEKAAQMGVRLFIIGVGDDSEGARIPVVDEQGQQSFLKYQDEEIWTKLESETLEQMAKITPGGRYLNVKTGTYDLLEVYHELIETSEAKQLEAASSMQYEEKFQIFLGLALTLLIIETLISERKRGHRV